MYFTIKELMKSIPETNVCVHGEIRLHLIGIISVCGNIPCLVIVVITRLLLKVIVILSSNSSSSNFNCSGQEAYFVKMSTLKNFHNVIGNTVKS